MDAVSGDFEWEEKGKAEHADGWSRGKSDHGLRRGHCMLKTDLGAGADKGLRGKNKKDRYSKSTLEGKDCTDLPKLPLSTYRFIIFSHQRLHWPAKAVSVYKIALTCCSSVYMPRHSSILSSASRNFSSSSILTCSCRYQKKHNAPHLHEISF